MIINLCGAPATGKSTFAARFSLEHSSFKYVSIDEYRIEYEDEARAWHELTKDVLAKRNCVIESCGMGWRLGVLLNLPKIRRRPLLSFAFMGDRSTLLSRLHDRQKRPLPEPFTNADELMALNFAIEHFDDEVKSRIDYKVNTTLKTESEVYHEVNTIIQRELLFRSGRREFRKDSFPATSPFKENQTTWVKNL